MSDFLTSLAQTALGSASLVQPRLASRFESGVGDGTSDIEISTDSSPSELKTVQAEKHPSPILQQRDTRKELQPPYVNNLSLQEPVTELLGENETSQNGISRDLHPSSIFASPTNLQAIKQDFPSTRAPQFDETKILSPLTLPETREKEIVRTHDHTETVSKELLPVVRQERINLGFPETPLLQPATSTILKLEKATQTPTPTVQVTIGRLEIRTPPQQKTVQHVSQASKPTGVMSLEEYRRKRGLE